MIVEPVMTRILPLIGEPEGQLDMPYILHHPDGRRYTIDRYGKVIELGRRTPPLRPGRP